MSTLMQRVRQAGSAAGLEVIEGKDQVLLQEQHVERWRTICVRFTPDEVTISAPVSIAIRLYVGDEDDETFALDILDAILRGHGRETLKVMDAALRSAGWHVGTPTGNSVGVTAAPPVAEAPGPEITYALDPWGLYSSTKDPSR
jgi:hypothetical protein